MGNQIDNWYKDWFDTDFYHILYQDRNHEEAGFFMKHLTSYLNLPPNAKVLDLACGRGRHSLFLRDLGFRVTGADLSEKAIFHAKKFEKDRLKFSVHDMSVPMDEKFDAVFNLFTSFGYFDDDEDHLRTLKAISQNLNESGLGVIDFMNTDLILNNLIPENTVKINDMVFTLKRRYENGYIFKDIYFEHEEEKYHYTERVKALRLADFEGYFREAGIDLLEVFGDYSLGKFHPEQSERLIMIFK